ncbi:two-component system NtrC family sensor kinase [Rhodoferax ferrireducens]|uniref:histidine kinase n=1 Tax=Rhodoferax ferrireducens TaxID=192843 RepID=A0ABU2C9X2_9BURK|nr:PAS domain S-box protein [Rhodoferax ferrireducens]MDR7378129.1 two-component system NtrC family sensor kinase [Rhodoferax ferrireducens]
MHPLDPQLSSLLLDHSTAQLGVLDRAHCYVYANRALLDFLGRSADQVLGRSIAEVLGQAAYAAYLPLAERAFQGESLRSEGWVDLPGRGRRYLVETLLPYSPDGGPVQLVASFGLDHSALKQHEQELSEQLAQLHTVEALKSAIVDHALAALISTDALGQIVEFNPAAEAMFGHSRAQVLGRPVSEVMIPPRFRAAHQAGMQRMQTGQPARVLGKRLEMHAVRADGSEFPMEMVLWRTDAEGSSFYTASIADLSERHNAAAQIERQREALRQSEKLSAMGSLLAGVAHELNNPLAIVMGRASLLEEKCADLPALQADAQRIREAAERCGRIVRTFLNMARSRPALRGPVDLNDMVRAATDMLKYGYRSHGISLELALADGLPEANVDGDQIGQVVMNLLVNAQQALASAQGARRVLVQTGLEPRRSHREPRVWLRVADNGPGVPALERDRVFEPFFTTKAEGIGTGMGLAVSRSLARDHGGDLALEPTPAEGGASFRLSLPISGQAEAPTDSAPAPLPEPPAAPQRRVLVVDDEAELVKLIRYFLESAGYEVATAESGAVALEMLDMVRFDAIVSDLRMPDMDGAGLWRAVSTQHPRLARAMLFVTGDTLSPDARAFLRSTRCDALDKPFTRDNLLARVAALMEKT